MYNSFTNFSLLQKSKISKKQIQNRILILLFIVVSSIVTTINLRAQAPPTLMVPMPDAVCLTQTPTLEWDIVINAVGYAYQVANDEAFTSIVKENLNFDKRTILMPKLNSSTTYYWRAGSIFSGDPVIKWSGFRKFTTSQNAPTLTTPANNAECQNSSLTFNWTSVPAVDSYHIQVSEFANFSSLTKDTSGIIGTSATFYINKGFTTFYWRTRTKVGTCYSDWSEIFTYQSKVAPPTITFPLIGSTGVDLSALATWASANGAANYDIQVSANINFTTTIVDATNILQNSYIIEVPNNNTTYYLRVRSKNQGCISDWSNPISYKTKYSKINTISPPNKATCWAFESPYSWQPMSGVSGYMIQISYTNDFTQKYIETTVRTSDTLITLREPSKVHFWRVKATDANNDGEWSDPKEFTSTIDAPLPLFPADKAENVSLSTEIRWKYLSAINGPYRLQIATDSTFDNLIIDDENAPVDTYTKLATNFLPDYNKVYYWRVYAQFSPCKSGWSKVFSFKTVIGFPELISPENDITNQPLTNNFTWQSIGEAKSYNIEFSLVSNFSKVEGMSQTQIGATEVTISNFNENTTYYWRVRTNNEWGLGPWSPTFAFTTGKAQAGVPKLISPPNNSTKVPLSEKLTWSLVDGAEQYRVQISDKSSFSTILVNQLVDINQYEISSLKNFSEFYWRVSAVNTTQESPFPARFLFRTIAESIEAQAELLAPADGIIDIDSTGIYFNWGAVKNAELNKGGSYKLIISDTEDFSNIIYENPSIYNNNFTLFEKLKGDTKYYWLITASNEAGAGPNSNVYNFTTKKDITSVEDMLEFPFEIYPNPTSDFIELIFKNNSDISGLEEIEIVNPLGQLVAKFTLTPYLRYDLTDLPSGRYSVKIKTKSTLYFSKFIKE